ncbi:MAG TPA: fatty acid oxidation complex subunit alpha FadJ [Polyangiaceae bacterium]|nr:fatty acid oxidation complex subunit alpha FadJ [Polyangiaceae bacterium]
MTTTAPPASAPPATPRPVELGTRLVSLSVEGGVAFVRYDVPGESVNALRAETLAEFDRALAAAEADPAVRAVVLESGKPDSFIVGADVGMLKAVKLPEEAERLSRDGQAALARLAESPKPVVAAVHGPCLGGGFEVALACHGRVASDDPKTAFGLPEVQLGLLPGADGLQRVADRAGLAAALDLGLTGKSLRPQQAKRLGLVDEVVSPFIVRRAAAELALALAEGRAPPAPRRPRTARALALESNPLGRALLFRQARARAFAKTQGHYPAVERIIDVLEAHAAKGFAASREAAARAFGELVVSETAARLMGIFFATTALKKDQGADGPGAEPKPVAKVAVLGAGRMGAGIAYVTSNAGVAVRLKDKDDEGLGRGLTYIADLYDERRRRGSLGEAERAQRLALVTAATDYSGVARADVVIEAVFEDLALKRRVLAEVEAVAAPDAVFASNTSSIPIAKIAEGARRPENVVGMHYFSPVHKMPLLEVVRAARSSPRAVATAVALGKRQGKTVIVVDDGVGFYTSRVLGPYLNEAAHLVAEGAPVEDVDRALVLWGWPVGPMALLDEVGLDVAAHFGPLLVQAFGERMAPPPAIARLVAGGREGRKSERGVYLYGEAARAARGRTPFARGRGKLVDPGLYALLGVEPRPGAVPLEEMQMRCSLQLVNEAARCLGEGVVRGPRDGDVGAVFGLGFPPFRGGPFRYVDGVGADEIVRRVRAYEDRFGPRWAPAPLLVELAGRGAKFYPEG